ncbi:RNA polymerase II C-terminal domain phosphatase-like 4 isoform X2 [Phalaenopsis equestris]|uniref:RNA polymerase II C-terminal domain phosphatase-like 4 isoform X2 n=1 Tax=Phalaenopsis equestris TaxID=78828 RepID=UPI0009E3D3E8|nr:RNA polymerase II C-terminal domain phosphatase-like 4 isoform X2 [Phalaenopsis equestris]
MSLEAESPLHSSSSSDDFLMYLNAELDLEASESSPQDEEVDNAQISVVEEPRSKRPKLDPDGTVEIEKPTNLASINENTGSSSEVQDEGICPPHPGFFKGLCMRCGQLEEDDGSGLAFGYIHKDLRLGSREIDRLRGADLKKLLREKKLVLILDLDHTLLNSTSLADVSDEEQYLLRQAESSQNDAKKSLLKLDHLHTLTKLRPFVHDFLKEANTMFEMYIYTMAERSYAVEIAKHLDPENVYFNSKVISQADSTIKYQKGLDVVLGADNLVVILDDTKFVWKRHLENLIWMEKYHFFASSCRLFGVGSKSLSQLKQDERDSDGALANILGVLKRAHQMFFDPELGTDLECRDVRQVLKTIKQEILQGCVIVFSRLYSSTSQPEEEGIWKMAEELGAICIKEVDDSVTHIVSSDAGTQKSRWALKNNKFLVNPYWIHAAVFLWRRQPEGNFPVRNSQEKP